MLRIKKREYRDGIKRKETRQGWGKHTMYVKHVLVSQRGLRLRVSICLIKYS